MWTCWIATAASVPLASLVPTVKTTKMNVEIPLATTAALASTKSTTFAASVWRVLSAHYVKTTSTSAT